MPAVGSNEYPVRLPTGAMTRKGTKTDPAAAATRPGRTSELMTDTFPTADQVAIAITESARVIAPDQWQKISIQVAEGIICRGGADDPSVARVRNMAALALHRTFDCGAVAIGRMVASGTPAATVSGIEWQLRHNKARWWDVVGFERVMAALRATVVAPAVPEPDPVDDEPVSIQRAPVRLPASDGAYVSAGRPLVPSSRQKARDMLAEAVRNTAALPIPD